MTPYSHTIWTELTLLGSLITSAVTVHANMIDAFVDGKKNKTSFIFSLSCKPSSRSTPTCQSSPSMLEYALDNVAESESSTASKNQVVKETSRKQVRPSRLTQAGKNSTSKEMVYSHTGHALSKKIIALCQQCIQPYRPCIACRQIDVVTMKQCKILRASRAAEPTDCWCSDRARICSTWSEQSSI